jgi:1-acyl-sn-glycerol-3-phosphate acyltransferase
MYTASWRDVVRRDLFGAAPDPRDRPYRFVIRLALIVFRLFGFRFDVRGAEHVPATGGAIICSNHVSFLDFTFLGLGALPRHRLVRFMAKSGVFAHWFAGPFMRAMRHIPVDRRAGAAAFESAVRALKDGEVVGVFPEATISRSFTVKNLKTGAARMAIQTGAPLIPMTVWGTQRIWTKGQPRHFSQRGVPVSIIVGEPIDVQPSDDPVKVTAVLSERLQDLLDQAQRRYPAQPSGPDDTWWLPASMGGSAPTPEEARAMDAAESHRR